MTNALATTDPQPEPLPAVLLAATATKDVRSRMNAYARWLTATGTPWQKPDLRSYVEYLRSTGKSESTVKSNLTTVRGRYRVLLDDNDVRTRLYDLAPADASAADRKAFVDETLTQLENGLSPRHVSVRVITHRDTSDADAGRRLTAAQADALLNAPGVGTLTGLRDTALIALLLCTGIRESELCNLDVSALRQRLGGSLALHIREGKGAVGRLVPYGSLEWCLVVVDAWLKHAGIEAGAVFRGFYKPTSAGHQKLRPGRLSVNGVDVILDTYPIVIDGHSVQVNPHDLRRTYARRLYEAGVPILAIQQNLGHADHKTTERYIGTLDAGQRRPPAVYDFDLSRLKG